MLLQKPSSGDYRKLRRLHDWCRQQFPEAVHIWRPGPTPVFSIDFGPVANRTYNAIIGVGIGVQCRHPYHWEQRVFEIHVPWHKSPDLVPVDGRNKHGGIEAAKHRITHYVQNKPQLKTAA